VAEGAVYDATAPRIAVDVILMRAQRAEGSPAVILMRAQRAEDLLFVAALLLKAAVERRYAEYASAYPAYLLLSPT
jgi:hypothetical protein